MDIDIVLAYVATVLILMSTPGPSQLLMLSNSMNYGFKPSLYTAAGDLTANFFQMVIATVGLVSLIHNAQEFFWLVKWLGVGYLVYVGLKLILADTSSGNEPQLSDRSRKSLFLQGFITSAANPKAVIFFAALFPQFIRPDSPLLGQFVVLSMTYLCIDGLFLCCYGRFALWIKEKVLGESKRKMNWLSGSLLMIAAITLGMKDIKGN